MTPRSIAPLCLVALIVCTVTAAHAQTVDDPFFTVTQVTSGLSVPTTMAFIAPDDILVCEKETGRVRRVIGGVLQSAPVLDLPVNFASERGLLGITTHPSFATNRFVYLYATISNTGGDTGNQNSVRGNYIVRFTWNGSALVSGAIILKLPVTQGPNHDGGVILFGPDGKLYAVLGDLNRRGKLQNEATGPAPDMTSTIFRLNDDGSAPPDNPFASIPSMTRNYAYGVRNSFGLCFDPVTGVLWDTENGETTYDEVNRVLPGYNSGWVDIMGPDTRDPQGQADLWFAPGAVYSDPEFSWLQTVAPTGLIFLAGSSYGAAYQSAVLVGDNNNGNIYRFDLNATRDAFTFTDPGLLDLVADNAAEVDAVTWGHSFGVVTDLKFDTAGRVNIVSLSTGRIYRLDPASKQAPVQATAAVSPLGRGEGVRVAWSGAATNVRIYAMDGRCVWSSAAGGVREITWDGRRADGARAPRGIYLARVETTGGVEEARIVLTR